MISILPCAHAFHSRCTESLFTDKTYNRCPCCREYVNRREVVKVDDPSELGLGEQSAGVRVDLRVDETCAPVVGKLSEGPGV